MSNTPYGSGNGPSGNLPDDDWFRPAPLTPREDVYRESQYGGQPTSYQAPVEPNPFDDSEVMPAYPYDSYGEDPAFTPAPPVPASAPAPASENFDDYYAPVPAPAPGVQALQSLGRPTEPAPAPSHEEDPYGADSQFYENERPYSAPEVGPGGIGPRDPDEPDVIGGGGSRGSKQGWRKYVPNWKITAGVTALGLVAASTLVMVGYTTTEAPDLTRDAREGVADQGTQVFWDDGKAGSRPIFQLGERRELVKIKDIPLHVRQAVMAAEQREFETDPGVSPKGLTRAVVKTVTGGEVQGGSTITQQLARNYLVGLSQERSLSRKYKEIFAAIKLDNKYSKDEILEAYLNTIDYGRNALGIQAASRAYFGKNVQQVSKTEGALLATMINRPSYFVTQGDPEKEPRLKATINRWNYVLDGMVTKGWMTKAERDGAKFPTTRKSWVWTKENGMTTRIRTAVERELKLIPALKDADIYKGGYKITLSLDKKLMGLAAQAVKEKAPTDRKNLIRTGLAAVNPKNGEIVAFFGGDPAKMAPGKQELGDAALYEQPQVGSTFKPITLATALTQSHNVKSMIDARSPVCMDGTTGDLLKMGETACANAGKYWLRSTHGGASAVPLTKAMAQSYNTSFVRLALKLDGGINSSIKMARALGVPTDYPIEAVPSSALGSAGWPAVYQAGVYSAFANGGTRVTPHMIRKITDAKGKLVPLPWKSQEKEVLSKDQAAQMSVALREVVTSGTGTGARLPDRQVAGKTGTTDNGVATWFVGYTPQLVTAVNVFHQNNKTMEPIIGRSASYGGVYPAAVWQSFMSKAMQGLEAKSFDLPTYTGLTTKFDTPKPKKTKPEDCSVIDQMQNKCEPPAQGDPNNQPGCNAGQLLDCDPNKPPPGQEATPPAWWCLLHKEYPACNTEAQPQQPPAEDKDHDGVPADQDPNDWDPNNPNNQHQPQDQGNGNGNNQRQQTTFTWPAQFTTRP